jgi:hypothetical protein
MHIQVHEFDPAEFAEIAKFVARSYKLFEAIWPIRIAKIHEENR